MKYSEEEYKQQVELIYNGELEVVGRYKGLNKPILVKDSLYIPNRWPNNSSTECFTENLLELIIKNIS